VLCLQKKDKNVLQVTLHGCAEVRKVVLGNEIKHLLGDEGDEEKKLMLKVNQVAAYSRCVLRLCFGCFVYAK